MRQTSYNKVKEKRKRTTVSLLIPQKYWKRFENLKCETNNSSADILKHLLEKHQDARDIKLSNYSKLTTQYQAGGLKLKKHSFWIDPMIWHQFKNLARFYGVSICFLFTALFCMLEKLGTDKKNYVPLTVKLYESLKIPYKIAIRRYRLDTS